MKGVMYKLLLQIKFKFTTKNKYNINKIKIK